MKIDLPRKPDDKAAGDSRSLAEEWVRSLAMAVSTTSFYGPEHLVTKTATANSHAAVTKLLAVCAGVEIRMTKEGLLVNGSTCKSTEILDKKLRELPIASFTVSRGMSQDEYAKLLRLIYEGAPKGSSGPAGFIQALAGSGIGHLTATQGRVTELGEDEVVIKKNAAPGSAPAGGTPARPGAPGSATTTGLSARPGSPGSATTSGLTPRGAVPGSSSTSGSMAPRSSTPGSATTSESSAPPASANRRSIFDLDLEDDDTTPSAPTPPPPPRGATAATDGASDELAKFLSAFEKSEPEEALPTPAVTPPPPPVAVSVPPLAAAAIVPPPSAAAPVATAPAPEPPPAAPAASPAAPPAEAAAPPPEAAAPAPAGIPPVAVGQIIAFLKGAEGTGASDEQGQILREAATDANQLADLILKAAEVRQQEANLAGGESLSDIIVGCLRRTVGGLQKGAGGQTQKAQRETIKTLAVLEETVLARLKGLAAEGQNVEVAAVKSAVKDMKTQIQGEALAGQLAKQRSATEDVEKKLQQFIARNGPEALEATGVKAMLLESGMTPEGWNRMVVSSPAGRGSGTGSGTGGGDDSTQAFPVMLAKLAEVIETLDSQPAGSSGFEQALKRVDNEVDRIIAGADSKIDALAEAARKIALEDTPAAAAAATPEAERADHGGPSRRQLLALMAEVLKEFQQPLSVIHCTITMLQTPATGPLSATQQQLLMLMGKSETRLADLAERLEHIV